MLTSEELDAVRGWFAGRLPDGLYASPLDVTVDREEITVIGSIPAPELADDASEAEREAAAEGRISEFRSRTRKERMSVARAAEKRYRRKVSWGVDCGGTREVFTNVAAPVMTRLRQPERQVLDTLIAGGVARSRSDALAWCVRLVQANTDDWLGELRDSLAEVQRVRAQGPDREDTPPKDAPPEDEPPTDG
ncbi:hypothetical protein [Streptomyces boninensis]|uniref:hypothetical protein n=1 Tax=Streptomyces boninensis TaxID=2039455 RepID=UPI003B218B7E